MASTNEIPFARYESLQAVAGPSPLAPLRQPMAGRDFVAAVRHGPRGGLRVAYCPDIAGIGIDPDLEAICRNAATRLVGTGIFAGIFLARFTRLRVATQQQIEQVVLSGGCFQNKRLLEGSITRLQEAGFRPFWSQKIPSNDGGIALGQIMAAQRENSWRLKCV